MPTKIQINTLEGQKRLARKQLKKDRVDLVVTRLNQIIQEMDASPTVAQRTEAIKDLARALRLILNHLSD